VPTKTQEMYKHEWEGLHGSYSLLQDAFKT
jgi:hypothetical protein